MPKWIFQKTSTDQQGEYVAYLETIQDLNIRLGIQTRVQLDH